MYSKINTTFFLDFKSPDLLLIRQYSNTNTPSFLEFKQFRTAAKSWDLHLCSVNEQLRPIVEPFAGQQFTPADPITVLGALLPTHFGFVREVELGKRVHIDSENVSKDGYLVNVENDDTSASKLQIVTAIDPM